MAAAPVRYVLADEVRDECIDIFYTRRQLLEPTPETPRVPHETLWVEWLDHRSSLLPGGKPGRVGMLVQSEARGRRGTAHIVYEALQGPIMAQLRVDFDFDNPTERPSELIRLAYPGECQESGFGFLLRHCSFSFEGAWDAYFTKAQEQGKLTREMLGEMARAVIPDFALFTTFLLLLGVERMVEGKLTDPSKINRARAKSGRQALLDHVSVHLSLSSKFGEGRPSGSRAAARLHQVRGHLVRRGGKTFWRMTHLRGDAASGMIASRTINVRR